jgi:hypothetical protein
MWLGKATGSWRDGNDHGGGVMAAFGVDGSKLEWPTYCEVADPFETRVAETILASVHVRAHQTAGHMNASDLTVTLQTIAGIGRATTHFGHEADMLVAKYLLHCFWYAKESGWADYRNQCAAVIA